MKEGFSLANPMGTKVTKFAFVSFQKVFFFLPLPMQDLLLSECTANLSSVHLNPIVPTIFFPVLFTKWPFIYNQVCIED